MGQRGWSGSEPGQHHAAGDIRGVSREAGPASLQHLRRGVHCQVSAPTSCTHCVFANVSCIVSCVLSH